MSQILQIGVGGRYWAESPDGGPQDLGGRLQLTFLYQNIPVDRKGRILSGENGPFVMTVPHDPGVDMFWSITRYGNDSRLPLNPADIGGNNIQAYNTFNTKPDKDGNVTITFSKTNPDNGTYWMPVIGPYYCIARYYGPGPKMNGLTVHDILYKGTKLESVFKATKY